MVSRKRPAVASAVIDRIMPRHAPFFFGVAAGFVALVLSFWLFPAFAVPIGANTLFIVYLVLGAIKLPQLSAEYLRGHAMDEDTPTAGIFFLVLVVVIASVTSLFLALNGERPDPMEVVLSVTSVLLGWFMVQAIGAFHYAYEYYQAPETCEGKTADGVVGGLDFPGEDEPDGTAFVYFSYTVGTSVATSDTKVTSNAMRRRLTAHIIFSHLYNTIILAAAVNVMMTVGGGG